MPMLTDSKIKSLKPSATRYEIWEGNGFGVRVTPKGAKSFVFVYHHEGRSRRLTLGVYPALSLADARAKLAEANTDLQKGIDPGAKAVNMNQTAREAPTFAEALEEFNTRELSKRKSGRELYRLLAKDCLPVWGHRKVKNLTRRDVVLLLDSVRERAPVTANRLHGRLSRFFNFCAERGIIEQSPIDRLKKEAEKTRERVLTDDEIRAFWMRLDETDIDPLTKLALRLILVTGQRPNEVVGMAKAEVYDDTWTIPASRSKTGKVHTVPLSQLALELLAEAGTLSGDLEFYFPSPRNNPNDTETLRRATLSRAIKRHLTELLPEESEAFTPHDLRRSFRTGLEKIGINPLVSERVLGHSLQGIAAVYNRHDYVAEKRQALDQWAAHLQRVIYGAEVLPFKKPQNIA